jgi:hypothetical protein
MPDTVTEIVKRELVLDATTPYRIAAGIFAPGGILCVVLAVASDDKSILWRLVIAALGVLGTFVFGLVALRKHARIPLGTTTVTRTVD